MSNSKNSLPLWFLDTLLLLVESSCTRNSMVLQVLHTAMCIMCYAIYLNASIRLVVLNDWKYYVRCRNQVKIRSTSSFKEKKKLKRRDYMWVIVIMHIIFFHLNWLFWLRQLTPLRNMVLFKVIVLLIQPTDYCSLPGRGCELWM